ncbi:MAG: tripartite tricarboxylate transporter TctB family protein [Pseudomonadota bacterium]
MRAWITPNSITGAVYLGLGLFLMLVLIPIGIDEPGNVEFAVLAPSYWPRVICLVLAALGTGMLVRFWINMRSSRADGNAGTSLFKGLLLWRVAIVIGGSFVLYYLLEPLGFVLAGALALALLLLFAGERRPVYLVLIAMGVPTLLYLFFTKAASIPIPAGVLEPILV